jgi:hypothetical protein
MHKMFGVVSVMLLLLCACALAADSKKVQLPQVTVYTLDYGLNGIVHVENKLGSKVKDLHATMMIPELGLKTRAYAFDLSSKGSTTKQMLLDSNIAPGEYYVRVTVGNGDVKRVKYRIITIE